MQTRKLVFAIGTALAAAAAVTPRDAGAVFLSAAGTGQVLVYPYYTVNDGNSTLITVVNTTAAGKAVKMRFMEGYDSRLVLTFNVYLAPYDVWVADVFAQANGAAIFTNDNSCTAPIVPTSAATAQPFLTAEFSEGLSDGGPTDASRTREGHLEVIEMGTVTNATHGSLSAMEGNGMPANCAQLQNAWVSPGGYWVSDASIDMAPPTGGLAGTGTIVNGALGTVEGYTADALGQFYAPGTPAMHTHPGDATPDISSGTSLTSLTFPGDTPVTSTFTRAIDAVSSLFMADQVLNEYWTSTSVAGSAEWVVTFPTRRFYVDPLYIGSNPAGLEPFDTAFGIVNFLGTAGACEPVNETYFSRDQSAVSSVPEIEGVPPPNDAPVLCYSTTVVTFGEPSGTPSTILGSVLTSAVGPLGGDGQPLAFENGWANLYLQLGIDNQPISSRQLASSNGNIFYGLPVTGFWLSQFVNGNVNGALANYTALYRQRSHAACDRGDTSQPCS
jgi:hypothetical protein